MEQANALKERMRQSGQALLWQTAALAAGFCLARSRVFEQYTPFGVAAAAAAPAGTAFAAAVGAMLGYLAPAQGMDGIPRLSATALAALAVWLLHRWIRPHQKAAAAAVFAGGCLGSVFTVLALAGEEAAPVTAMIGECCLAAGAAYFFAVCAQVVQNRNRTLSAQQVASVCVTVTLLLAGLAGLTIYDVSPARAAAVLVVLYAARYGREACGAMAGIAAGFAVYCADPTMAAAAIGCALGGLVAGLFAPLGKFGPAVGFVLANGLIAVQNARGAPLFFLYEVAAATLVFLVLPQKIDRPFARLFSPLQEHPRTEGLRDSMVMRLCFASEALQQVSQTVEQVADKLKRISAPSFEKVFEQTEQAACRACSMRLFCWETDRGNTLAALLAATRQLRTGGAVGVHDLPPAFAERCTHPDRLLDTLAQRFAAYLTQDAAERRLAEIRGVMTEQFEGVAHMLGGLAEEFRVYERYDAESAAAIWEVLTEQGLTPLDVSCRVDGFERLTVEIRLNAEDRPRVNRARLMRAMSQRCGRTFAPPAVSDAGRWILLAFGEQAELAVDYGMAQLPFHDNKLCGDAATGFADGRGRFVMILSDGMGKGGRAAVDGAMAAGLMERLMKAGFDEDSALKIVNAAMLYKSTDESLATVDVTTIDLFSGTADFCKAGAPPTLLRKNGRAAQVGEGNLPAGILQGVQFDRTQTTLGRGDMIVMVSDGALEDGADWIGVELETWQRGSAQALAEHLADYARRRCAPDRADDITVAVAILEKGW